jgi:hypothetical protein
MKQRFKKHKHEEDDVASDGDADRSEDPHVKEGAAVSKDSQKR